MGASVIKEAANDGKLVRPLGNWLCVKHVHKIGLSAGAGDHNIGEGRSLSHHQCETANV